jgi:hypothetical protein
VSDANSFDVVALLRELADAGAGGAPGGLEASWRTPEPFFRALCTYVGTTWPGTLKSRPYEGHDLYHDLVVRHLRQRRDVLVSWLAGRGWRRLSYAELHARATALAATWEAAGVEAGQTVALVLSVSEEYVLALLTAWRLGLVVSPLPPRGVAFVRTRLAALAPEYVVSQVHHESLVGQGDWSVLPLSSTPGAALEPPLRSHTYAADAPVARLFSPISPTPEQPVALCAGPFFLGLLRDAVLLLGLRSDDRVALPGFEPLQHQPWALGMTMLAGGCFLEAEERALTDKDTRALLAPTVVGVSPALRARLLEGQGPPEGWRLWIRNLAEPYDWELWERFEQRLASLPRCRGMSLVANAAFGGSLFFSRTGARSSPFSVLPTPGQPWQLAEVLGGDQPSRADSGLYAALGEMAQEASSGRFLLSRTRGGYHFSGSPRLGAQGQTYPEQEVVRVVESHPEVTGAAVVITPAASPLHHTRVFLLVFTRPTATPTRLAHERRAQLERLIDQQLGERYRPETMCFYPLTPRRTEQGGVDADWCRWQFLSGTLDRKSNDELFRMLSQVRWLLAHARPAEDNPPEDNPP